MRRHIKYWKWIALVLYLLIVGCLFARGINFFRIDAESHPDFIIPIVIALATLTSQVLFLTGAGTVDLCRPIRKHRLILPVIIGMTMMALLTLGVISALVELWQIDTSFNNFFTTLLGISWLGWGGFFFWHYQNAERFAATKGILSTILGGTLAVLLITIPAHIVTSNRPGCLAGLGTMLGIISGLAVMLWAFGPGIVLLFLYERRLKELEKMQREAAKAEAGRSETDTQHPDSSSSHWNF